MEYRILGKARIVQDISELLKKDIERPAELVSTGPGDTETAYHLVNKVRWNEVLYGRERKVY